MLERSQTTPLAAHTDTPQPIASRKTIAVPNQDGVARAHNDHDKKNTKTGFTNVPPRNRRFGVTSGHVSSTNHQLFSAVQATTHDDNAAAKSRDHPAQQVTDAADGVAVYGNNNISADDDIVFEKSQEDMIVLRSALRNPVDKRMRLLFDEASPELLDSILNRMRLRQVTKGANVVVQNGHQMCCFVVKSGVFEIHRTGKLIDYALVGFSMGACTLLHGCEQVDRSPWTITSTSDECSIWELDPETYRALVVQDSREKFDSKYACIEKCDIFSELTPAERLKLAEVVEFESFVHEEIIVEQGERDDKMFIVKSGRAVAFINGDHGPVMVKVYEIGDFFGEIALLMNEPRRASVVSEGSCECLYIDRETFSRTLGPCVNILKRNIDKYSKYNSILENITAEESEGGIDRFVSDEHLDRFADTNALSTVSRCVSDTNVTGGRLSGKGRSLSLMHTTGVVPSLAPGGFGNSNAQLIGDISAKEEEWMSSSKNAKQLKKKGTFSLKNVFADGWRQEVDSDGEEQDNVTTENQSLAERVNADFKRSAVVEPHLRIFPCQTSG